MTIHVCGTQMPNFVHEVMRSVAVAPECSAVYPRGSIRCSCTHSSRSTSAPPLKRAVPMIEKMSRCRSSVEKRR